MALPEQEWPIPSADRPYASRLGSQSRNSAARVFSNVTLVVAGVALVWQYVRIQELQQQVKTLQIGRRSNGAPDATDRVQSIADLAVRTERNGDVDRESASSAWHGEINVRNSETAPNHADSRSTAVTSPEHVEIFADFHADGFVIFRSPAIAEVQQLKYVRWDDGSFGIFAPGNSTTLRAHSIDHFECRLLRRNQMLIRRAVPDHPVKGIRWPWSEIREQVLVADPANSSPPIPSAGRIDLATGHAGQSDNAADHFAGFPNIQFFGQQATGKSIVYVVDSTGSMYGERFQYTTRELVKSINGLVADQKFFVLFFNDRVHSLFDGRLGEDLVPATQANKSKSESWIRKARAESSGDSLPALNAALEMKPDTIFFVTDGEADADELRSIQRLILQGAESNVTVHGIVIQRDGSGTKLEIVD